MTTNAIDPGREVDPVLAIARSVHTQAAPVVFVVDADWSVRESLELLIDTEGWQAESFASAHEFLSRARATRPCCLVLDVVHLFISGHADVPTTLQAMKGGAFDFLAKPLDGVALVDSIRAALERSRTAIARESEMEALRRCYASLTPRERAVMALVVSGLLNKQVGAELGISEVTVKAHRGQVMRKMMAGSLPDLVTMAMQLDVSVRRTS